MPAIAAEDFTYKIYLFDDSEADTSKEHHFKKGDVLPLPLVERLEKCGPEYWIEYQGDSKKENIPDTVDLGEKEEKPSEKSEEAEKYTREALEEMANKMSFTDFRNFAKEKVGVTGSSRNGIIDDILLVQDGKKEREV